MIDWAQLTLFLYVMARMNGLVLFNPILGRPAFFVRVLSWLCRYLPFPL